MDHCAGCLPFIDNRATARSLVLRHRYHTACVPGGRESSIGPLALFRDLLNLVKEFSCAGRMCQENDQHSGSAPQRRNEMLRHLGVIKALARRVARLRRYRMPVEQMLRPSSDKLDHQRLVRLGRTTRLSMMALHSPVGEACKHAENHMANECFQRAQVDKPGEGLSHDVEIE